MVLVLEPPEKISLLVIDDEPCVTELMPEIFADLPIAVLVARDAKTAMRMVENHHPRVVILDLHLRDANGMKVLEQIAALDPRIEVLLLSGDYSSSLAVEAIQKGAADFLSKPFPVAELRARVQRSLGMVERNRRTREVDAELDASFRFQGMVGRSPRMLDIFSKVARVAPHFRAALVTGDPGTGKKSIARALHKLSPARSGPFVVCDCANLQESTGERQLVGFENWSSPGLLKAGRGIFEQADQGTLVLDRMDQLPLQLQAKLLNVLQTREVQRLGSTTPRRVDTRVVAICDKDLCTESAEGRLREDLYYRFSALHIKLPPLSERAEDLPLLERHFVDKYAAQYQKSISGLSRRGQDLLAHHCWPRNVGELEDVIAAAVRRCEGEVVDVAHFPFGAKTATQQSEVMMSLRDAQRSYVLEILHSANGNATKAAEILKISLANLCELLGEGDAPESG